MRRHLTLSCDGAQLVGTIDSGEAETGLFIVSGGNEVRTGAHRGMAILAQDVAARGYPVFRFDRRGIGDSEGVNGGFASSGPDIVAALSAFRVAVPHVRHIVAFGNCDAATALVLHRIDVDARVLANPWVVELPDDLPAPAAIRARYSALWRRPQKWRSLMLGDVKIGSAVRGIARILTPTRTSRLTTEFAHALSNDTIPTTIVLAARDNTAVTFADVWRSPAFERARMRVDVQLVRVDSSSHSFANEADYQALLETLIKTLTR